MFHSLTTFSHRQQRNLWVKVFLLAEKQTGCLLNHPTFQTAKSCRQLAQVTQSFLCCFRKTHSRCSGQTSIWMNIHTSYFMFSAVEMYMDLNTFSSKVTVIPVGSEVSQNLTCKSDFSKPILRNSFWSAGCWVFILYSLKRRCVYNPSSIQYLFIFIL